MSRYTGWEVLSFGWTCIAQTHGLQMHIAQTHAVHLYR